MATSSQRSSLGLVAVAIVLATGTGSRARAEDQIDQALSEGGKVSYDKYCTPCHGAGGAPGKAVYSDSKQPVDLRTYVQRHGGKFPAADWLAVLTDARPASVHSRVWANIRRTQSGSGATGAARGIVGEIARYVASIQTN